MKITKKEVEYVATLARLELSEEEKELFTHQMDDILVYVDKLNELNVEGIEPTSHVLAIQNVFREDEVKQSLKREEALVNAPQKSKGHFKVPKIIE